MKFTVTAKLKGKSVSYVVEAENVKQALRTANIGFYRDAWEKLGDGEIVWEVEEDFL
jgi:hypothetical protein